MPAPLLGGVGGGFIVPMYARKPKEAFYEPAAVLPGVGVRQSSGALSTCPRAQKRQRTAAVQDASAPAAAWSRFMVPRHAQKRKDALHVLSCLLRTAHYVGVCQHRRLCVFVLISLVAVFAPQRLQAQLPLVRLSTLFPPGGNAGTTIEVAITGDDLDDANQLRFSHTNINAIQKLSEKTAEPELNKFLVAIGAQTPPGNYEARVIGRFGVSNPRAFVVGDLPEIISSNTNHVPESATEITLNTVVNGRADVNAVDYFRFSAKKGQRVLIECLAREMDSRMDDALILYDATGRELERRRRGGSLDFIAPADGRFVLGVSDFTYRGGEEYSYRLTLRAGPHLDFIFPPSGLPHTKNKYILYGRNLPGGVTAQGLTLDGKPLEQLTVEIELAGDPATPSSTPTGLALRPAAAVVDGTEYRLRTPQGVSNPVLLSFATAPVVTEQEPNDQPDQAQKVPLPCEFVGQFYPAGDRDWLAFDAKQGEVYWVEIFSHRLGLPTAPFALVQHATKNDKGEEKWDDVHELYAADVNLGGPEFNTSTRDPSWRFEVKEEGLYRIRVSDLFNRYESNPRFIYRLSLRKETVDFRLVALPQAPPPVNKDAKEVLLWTPLLRRGETIPLKVLAFRRDNFQGEIQLAVEGLPPGVTCAPAKIETNNNSGLLFLTAADSAESWSGPVTVIGKAIIADRELERSARAGSVSWTVPDYNNEAVRPRFTRDLFLAVSGVESAPITIKPAEKKIWEAAPSGKLQIPLQLDRRGEFSETLKLKASRVPALDGLKELEIESKTNAATLEIDLGQLKLGPGTHTFALQAQTKGKYRNNPDAAAQAEQASKQAEKIAADAAAEAGKTAAALAAATKAAEEAAAQSNVAAEKFAEAKTAAEKAAAQQAADDGDLISALDAAEKESEAAKEQEKAALESKAAAQKTAEEASAKTKEAEAKKTAAAARAKAAEERAKPRDVTITVYSMPITIHLNAEEKK